MIITNEISSNIKIDFFKKNVVGIINFGLFFGKIYALI